jgi:hypothetical protein
MSGEFHADIYAHVQGENPIFLGHGNLPLASGSGRLRETANLLHAIAWQFEEAADRYEQALRTLRTPLGDTFFEVARDVFVEAESREEAEALHVAGTSATLNERRLHYLFPELEELVTTEGEG